MKKIKKLTLDYILIFFDFLELKMSKKRILLLSVLIISLAILHNNTKADNKYRDAVERLKAQNKQMVQDYKEEIKKIQQEIREKNYKFKVGITEAFKYKIEEINGFQKLKKEPGKEENESEKKKFEEEIKKIKKANKPVEKPEAKPELKPEAKPAVVVPPAAVPEKTEEECCECKASLSRWDWREKGVVTDVKFQGRCGGCWAFAAASALESSVLINYSEKLDFSEQYFINCIENGCNGGNSLYVYEHLKSKGIPLEEQLPYSGMEQTCKEVPVSPYYAVASGYVGDYNDYEDPGVEKIKNAVCKYGPIVVSMRSTRAFHAYKGGIYDENAPGGTNHAILIVGWDDSKNAYIVKNSWGKDWGENGYVYMDYGTNTGKYARWVLVKKK